MKRRALPSDDRRRQELAAIHVMASKTLQLDQETYRALLERVTGHRSAADLDGRQRHAVLDEMRRLAGAAPVQATPMPSDPEPENVKPELRAMVRKVGAILGEAGRTWAYGHGTAKNMFKVQRIEWLNASQLHRLIAALATDQTRRQRRQGEG